MSVLLTAFVLFCGLGSTAFAAAGIQKWRAIVFAAAFILVIVWQGSQRTADPAWIGSLAASAAILYIFRSRLRIAQFGAAFAGGMLAASMASILRFEGLSMTASIALAALPPASAFIFANRWPDFAPLPLREEALLLVFVMGLGIAISPQILAGWNSALVLNREEMGKASETVSTWTLILTGAAAMLGGCYSMWRHR